MSKKKHKARDVYNLLESLQEGDVMEYGRLFKFDADEPVVWRCEESIPVKADDGGEYQRVTLHLYFREVMLRSVIALLTRKDRSVSWGAL